jgi:hypothetical protein
MIRISPRVISFCIAILISTSALGAPQKSLKTRLIKAGPWLVRKVKSGATSVVGWNLRDRSPVADWEFTTVDTNFALNGMQAEVSLVRNNSDGTLWVLKKVVNGTWNSFFLLAQEIPLSKIWREAELSPIEVFWTSDGRSILKTYIPGSNGEELLKQNPHFFSEESEARIALIRFVQKAANSGYFISDLRLANLVYDGKEFQIVDSNAAVKYDSLNELHKKYLDDFTKQWMNYQKDRKLVEGEWTEELKAFIDVLRPTCTTLTEK